MSFNPIFRRGFFCRAGNSLKVSATAANAWRLSFFVPVTPRIPIPDQKKEYDRQTDLDRKNRGQKRDRTERHSSTSEANSRSEATKLSFGLLAVAFREAAV
jgi:hypothetical protein